MKSGEVIRKSYSQKSLKYVHAKIIGISVVYTKTELKQFESLVNPIEIILILIKMMLPAAIVDSKNLAISSVCIDFNRRERFFQTLW